MSSTALLAGLYIDGVELYSDGNKLKLSAPTGTLPPERLASVLEAKAELITLLWHPESSQCITKYCTSLGIELLSDDYRTLCSLLPARGSPRTAAPACYTAAWLMAMGREPTEHKRQNAGRFAANTWLQQYRH